MNRSHESTLTNIAKEPVEKRDDSETQENWIGWLRGTVQSVGNKVTEKALSSMDTVITTLDPQMKEFISKHLTYLHLYCDFY